MEEEKKVCDCYSEEHHHDHCCSEDECDCCSEDNIVELERDDGKKLKFYLVDTLEHNGARYVALAPAEEMEEMEEDTIVIYEVKDDGEILPIEDEKLLDEVYEAFCEQMEDEEDGCDGDCEACEDEDCVCKDCEDEDCESCTK